jgi:hypothetical protein
MVSGKREKKGEEKKRRTIRKGGGGVSQNVGREEGASERDAREKTRLKLWREKDGAASCRRRRVRGGGTTGGGAGERLGELESFHATQVNRGNSPKQCHISTSHTLLTLTKSTFAPPVATQVRFSLTVPPLYRYRGSPLSLANREGGYSFFFSRRRPFPLINAWRDAAAAWCAFFSVSFQVLTVPFFLIPLPFVSRRPRLILSPSPRRPIATHRPHDVASVALPVSRVSLVASPPSATRLPCRVIPLRHASPLSRHSPPPRVSLVASLPLPRVSLVASPPRHASPLSRRPLVTRLPFAMHRPSPRVAPSSRAALSSRAFPSPRAALSSRASPLPRVAPSSRASPSPCIATRHPSPCVTLVALCADLCKGK